LENKAQREHLSNTLRTELQSFKQQILDEMRIAIAHEIDLQWAAHLRQIAPVAQTVVATAVVEQVAPQEETVVSTWAVGPGVYIDEKGVQQVGKSSKTFTETITTVNDTSITDVSVVSHAEGKSSQAINADGHVSHATTLTETTEEHIPGKKIVKILETVTIEDVVPETTTTAS
jgi:hypothetical protein